MHDAGHRTPDGRKSKNNISTPQGGGHNSIARLDDSINQKTKTYEFMKFINWRIVVNGNSTIM